MKPLSKSQISAKERLSEWKVGALFMRPGVGKTRVAVELVNSVPDVDLVVWIGPFRTIHPGRDGVSSVVDEINKWGGFKSRTTYYGVESIQQSDRIFMEVLSHVSAANRPFVVVDESLKIKNAEAKRTRRLLQIGRQVDYKLILNGTPISRNLMDMWSQMEFLSPKIMNMTHNQFKSIFCKTTTITKHFGGRKTEMEFVTGYENVDYLYSLIRHYVYECDLDLSISKNYKTIPFYMSDEERRRYEEIKSHYLSDETLEWRNNNVFMEMTTKMQHEFSSSEAKFSALDALFEEIPESSTIIFCRFISSQQDCKKRYPNAAVLSYQKEAYGLNMQQYNHTVYFDKIWDYAARLQAGHRTFRTGQEHDCYYYDITCLNAGIDSLIDRNIDKKVSMSEYLKKISKEQLIRDL